MSRFHSISLGLTAGTFWSLFEEASRISNLTGMKVNFEFNEVKVNIAPKSTSSYTWIKYNEAMERGNMSCFGEGV